MKFTFSDICCMSAFRYLRCVTFAIGVNAREWFTCTSRCSNHTVTCPVLSVTWTADGFSRFPDSRCMRSESRILKNRFIRILFSLLNTLKLLYIAHAARNSFLTRTVVPIFWRYSNFLLVFLSDLAVLLF